MTGVSLHCNLTCSFPFPKKKQVGFELIDAFAKDATISMDTVHCKAIFGKGRVLHFYLPTHCVLFRNFSFMSMLFICCSSGFVDGIPVFLAKPQTYMNLSGEAVSDIYVSLSYLVFMWH